MVERVVPYSKLFAQKIALNAELRYRREFPRLSNRQSTRPRGREASYVHASNARKFGTFFLTSSMDSGTLGTRFRFPFLSSSLLRPFPMHMSVHKLGPGT
jgi:hypothetical protein